MVITSSDVHPAGDREGYILLKYWTQSWNDLVNLTLYDDPNKAEVRFPRTTFYTPSSPEVESDALEAIAEVIGFPETKRTINYYLRFAEDPSIEDFLINWAKYQNVAHVTKHDRMYRQPDPRLPED